MKRIVLFGASIAGKNVYNSLNKTENKVICFVDNNQSLYSTNFDGISILAPKELLVLDFDEIIICSQDNWSKIYKQLIEELNINSSKISVAKSNYLKNSTFENPDLLKLANQSLEYIIKNLNEKAMPYFLDGGTLLGIARKGELIAWDNDIDISILEKDLDSFLNIFEDIIFGLNKITGKKWELFRRYYKNNTIRKIVLKNLEFQFNIAIIVRYNRNGYSEYSAVSCVFSNPEIHFSNQEWLQFRGIPVSVPHLYKDFLQQTYGDWLKEVKDWRYTDYKNINYSEE